MSRSIRLFVDADVRPSIASGVVVTIRINDQGSPVELRISPSGSGSGIYLDNAPTGLYTATVTLPANSVVTAHGYNPTYPTNNVSPTQSWTYTNIGSGAGTQVQNGGFIFSFTVVPPQPGDSATWLQWGPFD